MKIKILFLFMCLGSIGAIYSFGCSSFKQDPNEMLIRGARENNEKLVRKALKQKNININFQDEYGYTALKHAVRKKIIYRPREETGTEEYDTLRNKNQDEQLESLKIAELLLNAGADPDIRDIKRDKESKSFTALEFTISDNFPEMTKLLLKYGANPNLANKLNNGETPLIRAVHRGSIDLIKSLLDVGANPNMQDNSGNTPLIIAVNYVNPNIELYYSIVNLLLKSGANPNIQNDFGNTALILVVKRLCPYAYLHGYYRVVNLLLNAGTSLNLKDKRGKTALDLAKDKSVNHIVTLKELIKLIEDEPKKREKLIEADPQRKDKIKQEVQNLLLPELTNIVLEYSGYPKSDKSEETFEV